MEAASHATDLRRATTSSRRLQAKRKRSASKNSDKKGRRVFSQVRTPFSLGTRSHPSLSLRAGRIHHITTSKVPKGKILPLKQKPLHQVARPAQPAFHDLFPKEANFRQSLLRAPQTPFFLSYIGESSLIGTKWMLRFRVLVYQAGLVAHAATNICFPSVGVRSGW